MARLSAAQAGEREAEVARRWLVRLAAEPWCRVLKIPVPRGKGGPGKAVEEAYRIRLMREVSEAFRASRIACVLWRNNTGVAKGATGIPVQYGLPGAGDYEGIAAGGTKVVVELKGSTGKASERQEAYGDMVQSAGGIYLLVRDPAAGIEALARALGVR